MEVAGIAGEVGGFLANFFVGQEQLEETHKQKQEESRELAKQGKAKNVTGQAIDNVMYLRKVKQYYKDLEHMVRWELGMPDLWMEITEERTRLISEQAELLRLQKLAEYQAELKREVRRQRIRQSIDVYVAIFLGVVTVICSITFLMWFVTWEREWRWGN